MVPHCYMHSQSITYNCHVCLSITLYPPAFPAMGSQVAPSYLPPPGSCESLFGIYTWNRITRSQNSIIWFDKVVPDYSPMWLPSQQHQNTCQLLTLSCYLIFSSQVIYRYYVILHISIDRWFGTSQCLGALGVLFWRCSCPLPIFLLGFLSFSWWWEFLIECQ